MPESERTETLTRRGSERDERGERARERELGVETRGGEHGFQNKTLGTHTHMGDAKRKKTESNKSTRG